MRLLKDNIGIELLEAAITTPIAILVMLAIVKFGDAGLCPTGCPGGGQARSPDGKRGAAMPGLLCSKCSSLGDLKRWNC